MTENNVNIPLLRKAVEWAEAEAAKPPELCEWVQDRWRITTPAARQEMYDKAVECGTCYCVAGFVVSAIGVEPERDVDIPTIAAQALGIPGFWGAEDGHLFDEGNSIEDVRRIAESLAGERL